MTLTRKICATGIVAFICIAAFLVALLGNQRQAYADGPVSGTGIVCIVFTTLNGIGTPIPNLIAGTCPGAPPSSTGTLKVVKTVVGGTAIPSNFSVHVESAGRDISGSPQPGSASGTSYIGLAPGTYTVSETGGPSNYTPSFSGNCNSNGTVAVASSTTPSTCTITNTFHAPLSNAENTLALCSDGIDNDGNGLVDLADPGCVSFIPQLTVKKMVVNTGGGTAISSNFTITVTGQNSSDSFPGSESGVTTSLSPGAFSVRESGGPSGYAMATSTNCAGVVAVGDSKICTITNTFQVSAGTTTSDVSLTKTINSASPNIGDTVTYTLTITNSGPADAQNVSVTDLLPAGLTFVSDDGAGAYATTTGIWTAGTVGNVSSKSLHIQARVNADTVGQTITNAASVTNSNGDPNASNNTDSKSITPTAPSTNNGGGSPSSGGGGPSTGSGSSSGGGDGSNGPIVGSFSGGGGSGSTGIVLGVATETTPVATSTPESVESCDRYLTAFIRAGQENDVDQVKRLQRFLHDYESAKISETGIYDTATLAAVHAFQTKYAADILTPWGIGKSTGFVYLTTRKKVNEIYCRNTRTFLLTPDELKKIIEARASAQAAEMPAVPEINQPINPSSTDTANMTPKGGSQKGEGSTSVQTGAAGASKGWRSNLLDFLGNIFRRSP